MGAANGPEMTMSRTHATGPPPQALFRTQEDALVVQMPGSGVDPSWLARPLDDLGLPRGEAVRAVRVESPPEWRWGTVDAAFLARVLQGLGRPREDILVQGLPQDLQKLLALARTRSPAGEDRASPIPGLFARVGALATERAGGLRQFVNLLGQVVLLLPRFSAGRARVRAAEMLEVLAESSSRALLIVGIVNVLMGAIIAFVGAVQLKPFDAGIYVANLVGVASARELTPILTAIVLAGRTGASFAARIATMQGNEEIDALTTLGVSPIEFLVLPRVVALSLLMPLLYVYGCALALLGGLSVAVPFLDMSAVIYTVQTQQAIGGAQFAIGGLKALVFGALVALIGCHFGLRAERSAAGVGVATTGAVVASIVAIIAVDAIFAVCTNVLGV
ncbi:MAG TPA: ABC transporter permease [Burkholderiales bacterium]|nr:ABC transporter permease [Burkholderiales bacterium]